MDRISFEETASRRRAGVNFMNILQVPFHTKVLCAAFLHTAWLCNILVEEFWRKSCSKMLMKLTIGVNFINIPQEFMGPDPESAKRQSSCQSFCAFGILVLKSCS